MSLFLKASCGCIVLNIPMSTGHYIVVDPCDDDGIGGFSFFCRDLSDKTFKAVPLADETRIRLDIAKQLMDGWKLREIKGLLNG